MKPELRTYKRQIATKGLFQRLPDTELGLQKVFRAVLDRMILDLIEPRVSGKIRKEAEDFWSCKESILYVCDYAELETDYVLQAVENTLTLYGIERPWEK